MSAHKNGIALVTGGGTRLGAEFSRRLAGRGLTVAIHYNRSKSEAEALAAELNASGKKAFALGADLSDANSVEAIFKAKGWPGPCTVLVNSASLFEFDDIESISASALDRHFAVNLRAPALLSSLFAKQLPQGAQGVIVNISDQKMANLNPDFLSYTLTKWGIDCLTKTLAMALAPRIRVVGIAPGLTLPSGGQSVASFEGHHKQALLGRSSTPKDLCDALEFALDCGALTGQTLFIDGGQSLMKAPRDIIFT